MTLAVQEDLLLETAALGTLLLHVGAGEVAVDEGGLAGAEGADDAEPQVGHTARHRPLLRVDERVCNTRPRVRSDSLPACRSPLKTPNFHRL